MSGFTEQEKQIYALIARHDGLKARQIASRLGIEKAAVSRFLFASALMREMCYRDREHAWHALIRHADRHEALYDFSGWYGTVSEFMRLNENSFLEELQAGCRRIGRSLNDTRGLIHSFRDCREVMRRLFDDLHSMLKEPYGDWELAFEFRLNRARYIRIYADVLLITSGHVFSLEFKMKDTIIAEEMLQAVKYGPYLEILFGEKYDIIPALVLTGARDLFSLEQVPGRDMLLPVVSGDMLFNVLNEYMKFLR